MINEQQLEKYRLKYLQVKSDYEDAEILLDGFREAYKHNAIVLNSGNMSEKDIYPGLIFTLPNTEYIEEYRYINQCIISINFVYIQCEVVKYTEKKKIKSYLERINFRLEFLKKFATLKK